MVRCAARGLDACARIRLEEAVRGMNHDRFLTERFLTYSLLILSGTKVK